MANIKRKINHMCKPLAIYVLCILCMLSVCGQSYCQVLNGHRSSRPDALGSGQDASSVKLLQNSLANMGGASAWAQRTSARMEGTVEREGASHPIVWEDDWSTGALQFRHSVSLPDGSIAAHSGESKGPSYVEQNGHSIQLQHSTVDGLVPYQLPALILLKVLSDASYSIQRIQNSSHEFPRDACVSFMRGADLTSRQEWFLNQDTGLPDQINLWFNNVDAPTHPISSSVRYKAFSVSDGFTIPKVFVLQTGPIVRTVTFNHVTFNATSLKPIQKP